MNSEELLNISKDKFNFANNSDNLHDKELVTKPISYFRDAWNRFKRNQASIVATVIIAILFLFSIFGSLMTPYKVSYKDTYFRGTLPKIGLSEKLGIDFYDGCQDKSYKLETFTHLYAMGMENKHYAVKNNEYEEVKVSVDGEDTIYFNFRLDTYQMNGSVFKLFNKTEYLALQAYQNETGIQVIFPMTEYDYRPVNDRENANYWYKTSNAKGKPVISKNADGTYDFSSLQNIYLSYSDGYDNYNSLRIEGDTPLYDYAEIRQNGQYKCRVNYYEYYIYYHTRIAKDGITKPMFYFGTQFESGRDVFTCLASGARFSFLLAIVVAVVNLIVGAIYGAIEGYYGGKIDLLMERFVEILSAIPFMIVITLLKYHMKDSSHILILFISFFLTGWIGMAGRTRMQFYRFKNQEYVLAARTLGAKDRRIMFKHIFPNSLGTLITGSVLVIPSVIFSETSLSYLGIINLATGNLTSVGTLLSQGQSYLTSYPHMIIPPALFISLLMLSFNLFGNGLRDAFNPSLRGSEEG
ncbi:MAG: ABC transporter permease [Erysipelotrichaceae bacterium]|nr:ABC transporter permease [Erysipelotrichaceae bacterium]